MFRNNQRNMEKIIMAAIEEARGNPSAAEKMGIHRPPEAETGAAAVGQEDASPVIGPEQVREAQQILMDYKDGKQSLEERVVANEQWFKLRHWEYIRTTDSPDQVEPVSAWLFNSIANKHADAMDNFPMANILPREERDKPEAEKLTSVIPVVLDHSEYEQVYSDSFKPFRGVVAI